MENVYEYATTPELPFYIKYAPLLSIGYIVLMVAIGIVIILFLTHKRKK